MSDGRSWRRPTARATDGSTRTCVASCQPAMEFHGRVNDWVADVRQARERGDMVLFVADSHGRAERTVEILQEYDILAVPVERAEDAHHASVLVAVGSLSRGFRLADAALQLYAETDVFEEERRAPGKAPQPDQGVPLRPARPQGRRPRRPRRSRDRRIRRAQAARRPRHRQTPGVSRAPLSRRGQVVRPGRTARSHPEIHGRHTAGARPAGRHDVGEGQDARQEGDARHGRGAAQALRAAPRRPRPRVRRRYPLAAGVRGRVPYEPTVDQANAIADIKKDMEAPTPMDRLLCGDVGYGKTEVAMRAAFKSVMDGKQVAFLAPTTVLAFQHVKTLRERFAGFPVDHRRGQPLPHPSRRRRRSWPARRPGRSTWSSARTGCCPRTWCSRISGCSSSTRSSGSASRTRSASSRCARRSTC